MESIVERPAPIPPPRAGLAIACLVLGITAACLSFLLLGGLLGLIGLILGLVHLRRNGVPKAMAWWGISLSVLGLLASVGFGVLYFQVYKKFKVMAESASGEDLAKWEGVMAPDFTVTTLDGQTNALSDFKGKRVVLDFWATWCPPCRKEIPHFVRLVKETSRDDLIVIGISSEDVKTLREFVQKNEVNYLIATAKNLPAPYESIPSIPTTLFIDRQGVIQKVAVGYHDFDALKDQALRKDFEGPVKPQPVAVSAGGDSVQALLEAALTGEKAIQAFRERLLAFNRRTLTEAYQQVGLRDPKWDDLAVQYLDNCAIAFSEPQKAPAPETLREAGKQIADLGCNDPLILYCYGVSQLSCNDKEGAEQTLSVAAEELLKSKYPAVRQRYAATRMAYLIRDHGFQRQAEYETWRAKVIALLVKSLQDGSYRDDEQRVFVMQFDPDWDDLFLDRREEVYQVIKAAKRIDPWILKVVEGNYWIAQAWKARGSGWAKTVANEGWKGFYDGLAKARASLTSAWKMHPDYPEAAAKMVWVTTGEGDRRKETPLDWFGRAIQAQADYLPAYDKYEFHLFPRWGGSHEAMLQFGSECLATKRFDTAIPYQYYVMFDNVVNDIDSPGTTLWEDSGVFTNLQTMCEGYINSDNPPKRRSSYQTLYAAICWRTGRYILARRALDEVGDKVESDLFMRYFKVPFDAVRNEIYALTGTFADDLKAARALAASNFQTKAIDAYQDILARANGDSNVVAYAQQHIEALKSTGKMSRGEWITLTIPKDLTGWSARAGVWKVEDDGAVVGESTQEGLSLVSNQLFDQNLEIKGELEFIQSPYRDKFNVGIAVGATDRKPNDIYSCLLYRFEREAKAGPGFRGSDKIAKPASVEWNNPVVMRVQDGRLTFTLNDATVFENATMIRYDANSQQRIIIGGYYWYPGATVRFKNLQVRSLKDGAR